MMKNRLPVSYTHLFSGRDHTTIMHGCEKIEKELKESAELKKAINDLKQALS